MLADALFNLADYYSLGDVPCFIYIVVQLTNLELSVYPYAVYKLGWCYYNTTDYQGALNQFIQVIDLQNALSARQRKNKSQERSSTRYYSGICEYTTSNRFRWPQAS